jgi:hypothetical protein
MGLCFLYYISSHIYKPEATLSVCKFAKPDVDLSCRRSSVLPPALIPFKIVIVGARMAARVYPE